jgi:S1-C subfamily serine protease|tara:strand:- start:870 stop:2069 length:1200 start_codon:yes stop_codon:yes gene_type:complete
MRIIYLLFVYLLFSIAISFADDQELKFRGVAKPDSGIKKTYDIHESMLDTSNLEDISGQYKLLKESAEKLNEWGKILTLRGGNNIYSRNVEKIVLILNIIDKEKEKGSIGAGSLVDRAGYIITNWHVINGAPKKIVGVIFKDKNSNKLEKKNFILGHVVAVAKELDLALVKIEKVPPGRQPVQLSTWKNVKVGDKVHAIGHPKGLYWTYSQGIVSAKRGEYSWKYPNSKHQANVIQHQTPISSGNSGGALLDDRGRLIGINTSKQPGGENLNFAVAVDHGLELLKNKSKYQSKKPNKKKKSICFKTQDYNKNGVIDTCYIDKNNNGVIDGAFVDEDENGKAEAFLIDKDEDGKWEVVARDKDGNGKYEIAGIDEDGDGKTDVIAFDYNEDGKWDEFKRV